MRRILWHLFRIGDPIKALRIGDRCGCARIVSVRGRFLTFDSPVGIDANSRLCLPEDGIDTGLVWEIE